MFFPDFYSNPSRKYQEHLLENTLKSLRTEQDKISKAILDNACYSNAGGLTATLTYLAAVKSAWPIVVCTIIFSAGLTCFGIYLHLRKKTVEQWVESFNDETLKLFKAHSDVEAPFSPDAFKAFFAAKEIVVEGSRWNGRLIVGAYTCFALGLLIGIIYLTIPIIASSCGGYCD